MSDIKAIAELVTQLEPTILGRFRGLCPFHAERTPSFHIDLSRDIFHCFGCGANGNASDLVRLITERREDAQAETDAHHARGGRAR